MMSFTKCRAGIACALPFLAMTLTLPAFSQTTERVSLASAGTQGDRPSSFPSISADGRFVAFESLATNLVSGDSNAWADIFVHDRSTGVTERVSVASDGTQANDKSYFFPSISADGRYVAFQSRASNLVSDDSNGTWDVFVHDRSTGVTEWVNVASDGAQANFGGSSPSISADGRYVVFSSGATNLVSDDTNDMADVFVHDRSTGVTERVNVASDGAQANFASAGSSISADGRFVAFYSGVSNLVSDDSNGAYDVFIHDRSTGVTERVSLASSGGQGNGGSYVPSISGGGRFVAFLSDASNLVSGDSNGVSDIFVRNRSTGVTKRVSVFSGGGQASRDSFSPSISADGWYVTFTSRAKLVSDDSNRKFDVYVRDRNTGVTESFSQGNGESYYSSISADGRYVAFGSRNNLVSGDSNRVFDVFVRDRGPQQIQDI